MGMKHVSEYIEDWDFGERMFLRGLGKTGDSWCFTRLNELNLISVDLFCWPTEYQLWFNSQRKQNVRNIWPICYLIAKDDVIPIKIDRNPIVALQDPKELNYVYTEHEEIISIVLAMIKDHWKDILLHYAGYLSDDYIRDLFTYETYNGTAYAPDFLDKHPPSKQPKRIYTKNGTQYFDLDSNLEKALKEIDLKNLLEWRKYNG